MHFALFSSPQLAKCRVVRDITLSLHIPQVFFIHNLHSKNREDFSLWGEGIVNSLLSDMVTLFKLPLKKTHFKPLINVNSTYVN